ncbi:unannotated protein [freshwater metagenome]|uniref:Unannotated protein n=1 Tax=freshwater metagenome TaxID=449393 RepID=A0A6J6D5M0_9ZZZZ
MDSVRNAHLPLNVSGLAVLVDQKADHGCTKLLGQFKDLVCARSFSVGVFEICRVENGAAAEPTKACFEDLWLG